MAKETHRNALPEGFHLEDYLIDSILGHGGFGITYLAKDTHLDQWVAIKEYLPNEFAVREGVSTVYAKSTSDEEAFHWGLQRFIKEAQTLARFKHPNIVRVLRFFEAHNTAYMVMEYEDGSSLADYLRERTLGQDELLSIVLPLMDGLEKIHAEGFLHRDIKPTNIFLRHDGTPVLLDFGAARYALGQKTTSLTSIVSPGYAPFEQYDPKSPQGAWTDIYALGGVMYYAVTSERPLEVVGRLKNDKMPRAVELGEGRYRRELLQAIDWALALDEQARPQSIAEWREALLAQPLSMMSKSPAKPGMSRLTVVAAGLALLLLIPCAYYCYGKFIAPVLNEIPKQQALIPIDQQNVQPFIDSYFAAFEHADIPALLTHYAETVDYYGLGKVTHSSIATDKAEFFSKWPYVKYTLAEDLLIEELDAGKAKRVKLTIDFSVRNTELMIEGRALRTVIIRSRPVEGLKIIDEKEHVFSRHKTYFN